MSSFPTFRPRRRTVPAKGIRRYANRAAMLANAVATRTVATTTRKAGRPSTATMPTLQQAAASAVSAKTGGLRTVTSTRVKSSKTEVKATPSRLRVITADQMVRANTRTIKQVYQFMNEIDQGYGINALYNVHAAVGNEGNSQTPFHAYCLTTIDRPNTDLGTNYPQFVLQRDSSFTRSVNPVVFGNQTDPETGIGSIALSATGRLVMASAMIKLLFWARPSKSTTYDVSIIRFKSHASHLQPYIGPEESLAISGLTTDQLSERKAFWIDHLLRHMTVNPVALSKDGLSRMKKHYEVMYHKEITIDERSGDEEQNDHHYEQINLPINVLKNFNYSVNSRYDLNTANDRVDSAINTSTNDLYDVNQYHKCSFNSNIWLIIKANNTVASAYNDAPGAEANPGELLPNVPSYDISFECKYKTFSVQ